MRTIREIEEGELDEFVRISAEAYPGIKLNTNEERQRFRERIIQRLAYDDVTLWGLFEANELLGVMRLYDFTMKLHSIRTLIGGVGGVAVDLRHKKEKIAAELIRFFLHHYREKGACLTELYPFRPDFYKQMGYGFGTKMNHYSPEQRWIIPANKPIRI
jgi:predicted acetyltransferase